MTTTEQRPSADIDLLNVLKTKEYLEKYLPYVKEYACSGYTMDILKDIPEYFKFYPSEVEVDWPKFQTWFRLIRHPTWKKERHELFELVFSSLVAASGLSKNTEIINHFIRLDYATRIAAKCREVEEGKLATLEPLQDLLDTYSAASGVKLGAGEDMFASNDIKRLLDEMLRSTGLEWRLEDLNRSLGPLHKGDLVMVAARPEVGKTSFLCSEFTYMAGQLPEGQEAIIFNNEERNRLLLRLLMTGTGMSLVDIGMDEDKAVTSYKAAIKGGMDRIRIVEPEGGFSTRDVERVLSKGNYGLIGINVMDKVTGFDKMEQDVARQRELAKWARGIASKYAPTVVVYQADGSAEGHKWLNQSQVYGSKTGVQGEADALLMIGADPNEEDKRYVSVAKNKLPGGKRSMAKLRHGKFEVAFDQATGRYTSLEFK